MWRLTLPRDSRAAIAVDGDVITIDSPLLTLRDLVRTAASAASDRYQAPLRIVWRTADLTAAPAPLEGFERVEISAKERVTSLWKRGEWYYAAISAPSAVDRPTFIARIQHHLLLGKRQPESAMSHRAGSTFIQVSGASLLDDGTFTLVSAHTDVDVAGYRNVMQQMAAREVGTEAAELIVDGWRNTDEPLRLSTLRGRLVLLDFWGTWCTPCVASIPKITSFAQRFRGKMTTIAVHSMEGADRLSAFLARRPFPLPIAVDSGRDTEKLYMITEWPTYVLIDKRGAIRYRGSELPDEKLVARLAAE
ncbi:MAG TPA: TlpA disulfide reductase family protein [Thermoanaerobaculia bacterium]|nr:TlpA disulfide reductase family protein [Thermoanaerobaculia bacterium]